MGFFVKGVNKPVQVSLRQLGEEVTIVGKDASGNSWLIFTLFSDGTFKRHGCIIDNIGISVDSLGRIKEVNNKGRSSK